MTDIDKLKDRELDVAVAEARGMRRVEPGSFYVWPSAEVVEKLKTEYPDLLGIDYAPAPWFSTDIAAAWELVEEMRALDYLCAIFTVGTKAALAFVDDKAVYDSSSRWGAQATGSGIEAVCTAIARAYLKAKASD